VTRAVELPDRDGQTGAAIAGTGMRLITAGNGADGLNIGPGELLPHTSVVAWLRHSTAESSGKAGTLGTKMSLTAITEGTVCPDPLPRPVTWPPR